MNLLEQLKTKQEEFKKLEMQLQDQRVISDTQKLKEISRSYNELKDILESGEEYKKAVKGLRTAKEMLSDPEMKEMAEAEIAELEEKLPKLEQRFLQAIVPKDPLDKKNVIIEIRAGTGGDEAALFATDLYRMYTRFAEHEGWKHEMLSSSQNEMGGFKSVEFSISGSGVYGKLKHEAGVHRVQRVPETEKQGRVHTSTATVAVLPEIEETEFAIPDKDLKIEATTSTGAGGQSVNTTYSAIRVTHLPTGTMVYCQDERSQKQNKIKALKIIRARVYEAERERQIAERSEERRGQIGTGERSEKIRTYNYPQDRVTDHRIKKNYSNIPSIMDGDIDMIMNDLKSAEIEQLTK